MSHKLLGLSLGCPSFYIRDCSLPYSHARQEISGGVTALLGGDDDDIARAGLKKEPHYHFHNNYLFYSKTRKRPKKNEN